MKILLISSLRPALRLCLYQDRSTNELDHNIHKSDSLALLKLQKQDAADFQSQKNKIQAEYEAEWRFFNLLKDRNKENKSFLDDFSNCVNVVELCGGSMVDYEDIEKILVELSLTRQTAKDKQMKAAKATSQDKLLGVAYLM